MLEFAGKPLFYVADKLVDAASNSIIADDKSTRIEPKAMRVLTLLAENAGQVVTRQALEDEVWTDLVVGPDALTNTVIKLRRALGDDAKNARFIETIPKTGYRLIAPVRDAGDGEQEQPLERRLSAILYADVAEYSRLTGEDEERTHRTLSASLDHFSESIRSHNGTVVHYAGDAILAEFTTVTEALGCAVATQRDLLQRDAANPDSPSVRFRIGINLGEVIVDRDDIYGDGVNIAARLEGLADAGGICISESVYAAIGNKLPFDYEFMGEQKVKNIAEPVRAYSVVFAPGAQQLRRHRRLARRLGMMAAVLVALIGAILFVQDRFGVEPLSPVAEKPTIAVLPFANVSVYAEEDYFAEAMTRDIITGLTKISGVYVIAYSSVEKYKNQPIEMNKIRQELGVRNLIEGSIIRAADRVKINVQLVTTENSQQIWAERYDGFYEDIFRLQDQVVREVATAVSVSITESESAQIARPPTTNFQALDYYQRAEQSGYIGGTHNLEDTLKLYQRATELDPEFAEAHAGLARTAAEIWRNDVGFMHSIRARQMAYDSAQRALDVDPGNGRAHSVLAILQLADGHHDAAIASAREAVARAPGSAAAHLDLGLVLAYAGESKRGVEEIETMHRLNPDPSPDTELYAGIVYFIDGQYEQAEVALSRASQDRRESEPGWTYLAAARAYLGRTQEAAQALEGLIRLYPNSSLEYYRARDNYFRNPEDFENFLAGLQKAGLPTWAYGFDGSDLPRLDEAELQHIVYDQNWAGHHVNGPAFFQHNDADGNTAYRSKNSIQTGKVSVKDGKLCQLFDGTSLNRDLCGYVYKNPQGSSESLDEYIAAMPTTLRYFSISQ